MSPAILQLSQQANQYNASIIRSLPQKEIVDLSLKHGIALTSYSPLGSTDSPLHSNPTLLKIAEKYAKNGETLNVAAVLVSFQVAHPNRVGKSTPFSLSLPRQARKDE